MELSELAALQVALPAENGADGAPEIAAEAALPALLTTIDCAPEAEPVLMDPKFRVEGDTDSTGEPPTVSVTVGLTAVALMLLVAFSCNVWVPMLKAAE
jgi:hypothetical protein